MPKAKDDTKTGQEKETLKYLKAELRRAKEQGAGKATLEGLKKQIARHEDYWKGYDALAPIPTEDQVLGKGAVGDSDESDYQETERNLKVARQLFKQGKISERTVKQAEKERDEAWSKVKARDDLEPIPTEDRVLGHGAVGDTMSFAELKRLQPNASDTPEWRAFAKLRLDIEKVQDPKLRQKLTNLVDYGKHKQAQKLLESKAKDSGLDPIRVKDEDLAELGDMLKQFFGQEAKEPEHAAADEEEMEPEVVDADPAELEELLGAGEEPDAEDTVEPDPGEVIEPSGEESLAEDDEAEMGECAHCGEATDAVNCPKCGCTDRKAKDKAKAADAAAGVKSTLKYLRPFIARSNDAAAKAAWNNAMALTTRSSRSTTGSYGAFANSARARDSKRTGSAPPAVRAEEANTKLQSVYDQLREKGGK